MENVVDSEGQTRFFDELGRKFHANIQRDEKFDISNRSIYQ